MDYGRQKGQCIAIVSGKGGTGKTSFTAGVGSALAMLGYRTLCIECDVGLRNLDLALGLAEMALMDFSDVAQGRCALDSAVVEHPRIKNLFLLTAPARMRGAPLTAEEMTHLLDEVRKQFDYCLLDASAGLGYGFSVATCCPDRCIVVTTSDSTALRDAQHTVMELNRFPRGSLHLVVNRVRKKMLKHMHATIDDAIDTAGLPLLGVVPDDDLLILALSRGVPLLLTSSSLAGQAYKNIAARITGKRVPLMRIK